MLYRQSGWNYGCHMRETAIALRDGRNVRKIMHHLHAMFMLRYVETTYTAPKWCIAMDKKSEKLHPFTCLQIKLFMKQ